jgi:hypothetical protein
VEDNETITAGEDLEVPLVLEYEYGDFRKTCFEADPVASAFLRDIPDQFFHFNQNFLAFITTLFSTRVNTYKILYSLLNVREPFRL